jgi:hypothetical protein
MRKPIAFDALQQIDPLPKTKKLISQNRLVEADEYLSFFVDHGYLKNNEQAQSLLIEIKRKREDLEYRAKKIADGVLEGKSDELDGQIAAGISDFFLFGDLRDLTIEGYHKLTNQEVDEVGTIKCWCSSKWFNFGKCRYIISCQRYNIIFKVCKKEW